MKAKLLYISTPALWLCAVMALATAASPLQAEGSGKKKNPTSKVYVADLEGESSINTGDRIDDLTKKSVYSAEGTTIKTKPDSNSSLVLSNGTGMFFDPDTELKVDRFLQEPFDPHRNDTETEPSISQTSAYLKRGSIGLCTSKMVAGSTMTYSTPQASVAIRGRKVVIECSGNTTTVSLLEGDVTIRGDLTGGGESLKSGQQAVITRNSPTEPPVITIQDIPADQKEALGNKVNMACMARKTVYFTVEERKDGDVIVPHIVIPPSPPPPVVSPYSL